MAGGGGCWDVEDAVNWTERWRAEGKTGRGRVLVEEGGGCHQCGEEIG